MNWRDCPNPRCTAQVTTIDGQVMSREWSQNGAKLLGYRFHECKVTSQESKPVEKVYYSKWIRKGSPEWVRFVGPTKEVNTTLMRPPDLSIREYGYKGSKESVWERAGVFTSDVIKWRELSNEEIEANLTDSVKTLRKNVRFRNPKGDWEL